MVRIHFFSQCVLALIFLFFFSGCQKRELDNISEKLDDLSKAVAKNNEDIGNILEKINTSSPSKSRGVGKNSETSKKEIQELLKDIKKHYGDKDIPEGLSCQKQYKNVEDLCDFLLQEIDNITCPDNSETGNDVSCEIPPKSVNAWNLFGLRWGWIVGCVLLLILTMISLFSIIALCQIKKRTKNVLTEQTFRANLYGGKQNLLEMSKPHPSLLASIDTKISEQIGRIKIPSNGNFSAEIENLRSEMEKLRRQQDEAARKEEEILQGVAAVHDITADELSRLREQSQSVIQERSELTRKTLDAERITRDAQKKIEACESEITRAVDNAKLESQAAAQKKSMADRTEIETLRKENGELKSAVTAADAKGFERGIKESGERITTLAEQKGRLETALEQMREQLAKSNSVFQEKINEARSSERSACEQKFAHEKEKLLSEAELKRKEAESSAQRIIQLQTQLEKSLADAKKQEMVIRDAEQRASTSIEQAKKIQNSFQTVQKENESLAAQIVSCKSSITNLTQEKTAIGASLQMMEKKINIFQETIYPAEFLQNAAFAPLKEHLDSWLADKIAPATIVLSSLGLFSQRALVNAETWQQALRNISIGIVRTLDCRKKSADEIVAELVFWSNFLVKFSDGNCTFSLQVPAIGDNYQTDWMSAKNAKIQKVEKVLSWAVFGRYGIRHNAEVE